ncbi:hypothetical protein K432DRAFT_389476 [Lepidopterella palustris CBS 459.81]|uniref:Uncharacterized protein n=1 Tax=Lepidopterella palustris CBS 459.81 TaxID=1314670 RepID=A0A8E2EJ36_9PEZI|nr:hypothetical protein K432DRAFT_389476 [Lepidopterella palustris CBS 459.81]
MSICCIIGIMNRTHSAHIPEWKIYTKSSVSARKDWLRDQEEKYGTWVVFEPDSKADRSTGVSHTLSSAPTASRPLRCEKTQVAKYAYEDGWRLTRVNLKKRAQLVESNTAPALSDQPETSLRYHDTSGLTNNESNIAPPAVASKSAKDRLRIAFKRSNSSDSLEIESIPTRSTSLPVKIGGRSTNTSNTTEKYIPSKDAASDLARAKKNHRTLRHTGIKAHNPNSNFSASRSTSISGIPRPALTSLAPLRAETPAAASSERKHMSTMSLQKELPLLPASLSSSPNCPNFDIISLYAEKPTRSSRSEERRQERHDSAQEGPNVLSAPLNAAFSATSLSHSDTDSDNGSDEDPRARISSISEPLGQGTLSLKSLLPTFPGSESR